MARHLMQGSNSVDGAKGLLKDGASGAVRTTTTVLLTAAEPDQAAKEPVGYRAPEK